MEKEKETKKRADINTDNENEAPFILEEIEIEELAIDGICGVY